MGLAAPFESQQIEKVVSLFVGDGGDDGGHGVAERFRGDVGNGRETAEPEQVAVEFPGEWGLNHALLESGFDDLAVADVDGDVVPGGVEAVEAVEALKELDGASEGQACVGMLGEEDEVAAAQGAQIRLQGPGIWSGRAMGVEDDYVHSGSGGGGTGELEVDDEGPGGDEVHLRPDGEGVREVLRQAGEVQAEEFVGIVGLDSEVADGAVEGKDGALFQGGGPGRSISVVTPPSSR